MSKFYDQELAREYTDYGTARRADGVISGDRYAKRQTCDYCGSRARYSRPDGEGTCCRACDRELGR